MGAGIEALRLTAQFLLYGAERVPVTWKAPLFLIGIYLTYLLVSSAILYGAVRLAGAQTTVLEGFPKAVYVIFVRDLLFLPLILLTIFFPFIGAIIWLIVWLGLIHYTFKIGWGASLLAWIIAIIVPLIIAFFIIIPIANWIGIISV